MIYARVKEVKGGFVAELVQESVQQEHIIWSSPVTRTHSNQAHADANIAYRRYLRDGLGKP